MPADAVLSAAIENCMGGARPLLAECTRPGTGGNGNSRPALGVDMKQMSGLTKTERDIVKFIHFVVAQLKCTNIRYPDETHVLLPVSVIECMQQAYKKCRTWSSSIESRWIKLTRKLDARAVQESIARLIATGSIVTEGNLVECKYVKHAEGGRPSKLREGFDIESATTIRNNQAAVIREIPVESSSPTSLAEDFARDTDPSLNGRTFSGLPQMFGHNVTSSIQAGTFTVRADPHGTPVMLPDRNYIGDGEDDLPPPPTGAMAMFDGSSAMVPAKEANERARRCHLNRLFPNLPLPQLPTPATTPLVPEPAPVPVSASFVPEPAPARTKRPSEDTDAGAADPKRTDVDPDPVFEDSDAESDLDPELDWAQPAGFGDEDE